MVLTTPWPLQNSLNWYVVGLVRGRGGGLRPCFLVVAVAPFGIGFGLALAWAPPFALLCRGLLCRHPSRPCTLVPSRRHQVLAKYGEDTSRGSYAPSPSSSSTLDLTLDILAFKRLCRSVLHGAGADDRVSGDGVG